jgi:putative phosphoribosyl transferase
MTIDASGRFRRFENRRQAGQLLARRLQQFEDRAPVVLALPRGGVPVAAEVARALGAPLDVIVVRKLGVPFQPELGFGAVGEDGVLVLNESVVEGARVTASEIAAAEVCERAEVARRARRYRGDRDMVPLEGRTVIVVDDGIATGGTARAALQVARAHGAREVILAVPLAPHDTVAELASEADEVVVLATPEPFFGVGQWYVDFTQTTDEEVTELLAGGRAPRGGAADGDDGSAIGVLAARDRDVAVGPLALPGILCVPDGARGIVLFAHGSGSSRHSSRNVFVARRLQHAGFATLLFDLLTPAEELDRANVFDVELLAVRLLSAAWWVRGQRSTTTLSMGYFGASTGAAAALWAAAEEPQVSAVVSRGGRPDLAAPRLAEVEAPTLLVVGGLDTVVLGLNRRAAGMMRCEHRVAVVPGATHLFEEPGTLSAAADLAVDWFGRHLHADELATN